MTIDDIRGACVAAGLPGARIEWRSRTTWAVCVADDIITPHPVGAILCVGNASDLSRELSVQPQIGKLGTQTFRSLADALTLMRLRAVDRAERLRFALIEADGVLWREPATIEAGLAEVAESRGDEVGLRVRGGRWEVVVFRCGSVAGDGATPEEAVADAVAYERTGRP